MPASKPYLNMGPLTLRDIVKLFRCINLMARFQGITDQDMWWLKGPIFNFEGSPFRIKSHMKGSWFRDTM